MADSQDARARTKFYTLQVCEIRRETPDTVSVAFAVPEGLRELFTFTQGQYLTLRAEINGSDERRSYSICSAPYESDLRVAIKKVPGIGRASCRERVLFLHKGVFSRS